MYVSIALARAVVSEVERRGKGVEQLLERAELPAWRFDDPRGELAMADYERLILAALDLMDDPSAGLLAGYHAPAGAAHLVGFVLVNSRTLRDALTLFQRYASLVVEGVDWRLVEDDDVARFGFVQPKLQPGANRFATELLLGYVASRMNAHYFGPEARIRELRLMGPRPADARSVQEFMGMPLEWDAERNELVFDPKALDVGQRHADAWVCQMMCEKAERLLGERQSEERLRLRVKDSFKYHMQLGRPDNEAVASSLGLSARTMRRRLAQLGYNFRDLVDEARQELACDALQRPQCSIKEVAYALGFAEPSAFHRAFKRWMGVTPREFQAQAAVH